VKKKLHEDIINNSHNRSKHFGIEKDNPSLSHVMPGEEFIHLLHESADFIEIAEQVIDELYSQVRGTGFIIILTNKEGCILKILGDPDPLEKATQLNIIPGAYVDERSKGTNAMGTALSEDAPVQISAKEHFLTALQQWTCSAAPIHDRHENIIGTLNLTGDKSLSHRHTLGLVVAASRAIENAIHNDYVQKKLFEAQQYAYSIMNTVPFGVFALDKKDSIKWVNDTACKAIKMKRTKLINTPIDQIFSHWKRIKQELMEGNSIIDVEETFDISSIKEKFLFNGYEIKSNNEKLLGYILSFRELSRLIGLVNRYSGSSARFRFEDIIGKSSAIKPALNLSEQAANTPSTVLITGESGTGKEVFAQAIHNASERKDAGFVAINCGAISESLIESELFGYDEGAFTGAKKNGHPGKFELANKGTLFLDEIGEMPMEMQVRLLRAIQEGSFTRVGGEKNIEVDVRIIAATNQDLEKLIERKKFRLDLYYRLNVIHIDIPPLRERLEDLANLIRFFMARKSKLLKKEIPELPAETIEHMYRYKWPGNIRELENFIEKAVLLDGNVFFDESQMGLVHEGKKAQQHEGVNEIPVQLESIPSLEETEKKAIKEALRFYNNNISRTAQTLKIGRNTLYDKINKYNLK